MLCSAEPTTASPVQQVVAAAVSPVQQGVLALNLLCLDWLMPPKTQCPAQVIPVLNLPGLSERNPPGQSEVYPQIFATALTIKIPPEMIQLRKYLIALANISNEDFQAQHCFKQEQWEFASPQTRIAWRAFYQKFVRDWTAYPEFASGHQNGGYLYCTAGSVS